MSWLTSTSVPDDGTVSLMRSSGSLFVLLSGELDKFTAEQIGPIVREAVDDYPMDTLIAADAVRFVDGAFLRLLEDLRASCLDHGCRCRIVGASPPLVRLCSLLELDHLLEG